MKMHLQNTLFLIWFGKIEQCVSGNISKASPWLGDPIPIFKWSYESLLRLTDS